MAVSSLPNNTDVQVFEFAPEGALPATVRVIQDEQGEPWFVLNDVCAAIGIANPWNVAARLNSDETNTLRLAEGNRGNPNVTVLTEPGLYRVILRSDSPAAEPFRRWVTHEVLPSIRRHGMYAAPRTLEALIADPATAIRLLTELQSEQQERRRLEAQTVADAPKVLFANSVAASDSTCLVGELAKILKGNGVNIGANRLFKQLRADGYLIRRGGTDWNMPTQKAMNLGLFVIKETAITHSDGHVTVSKTPKVTGKGQQYFVAKFLGGNGEGVAA